MEKLITIRSKQGVLDLIEYLKGKDFMAVDTETTGVDSDSVIIGLSVCAEPNVGYYVIVESWNAQTQKLDVLETKELMPALCKTFVGKPLIMHNGVFDCSMIWNNYKVRLIESLHTDTMILAHLLDENRRVGLKELGAAFYGADAKKEQEEMKASVTANGGVLTKEKYEMYKADPEIMAKYGAKDAILTYNLFFEMVPELYGENLDKFFYEDESMPLLRGPTYDLNTVGVRIDQEKLETLKKSLQIEIAELRAYIYKEITPHLTDCPIASAKKAEFNVGSGAQLAWLLFDRLENVFPKLSDAGRELAGALGLKNPYTNAAKREFVTEVKERLGYQWRNKVDKVWDRKARRYKGDAKVKDYWNYLSTDKGVLQKFSKKYKWVEKLLEYKRLSKLLSTYVEGIQAEIQYGLIKPSFLQHGTTSGRYSCKNPNFQNLPRKDKRIKSCLVSRPGKVFVGADYSQLEPRVFASFAKDERLLKCFKDGDDFYSVIGVEVFEKYDCTLKKDDNDPKYFGNKYPNLRDIAKVVALSSTYGTTAPKMAPTIDKSTEEAQEIIDSYFSKFPQVKELMLESHEQAMTNGSVHNLFGRPRRMPAAKEIKKLFPNMAHAELQYEHRNLLNLSINHRIQSTGASIMNRAAIAFWQDCKTLAKDDPRWLEVAVVMQVHDELIAECPEELAEDVVIVLKNAMENTTVLPGVELVADPKIGKDIASLK